MDNFSPINQKDPLTTFFVSFQLIAKEVNKIRNLLWFSVTGRFYAMKSVSKNWKRNPIFLTSLENSIVEKGKQDDLCSNYDDFNYFELSVERSRCLTLSVKSLS